MKIIYTLTISSLLLIHSLSADSDLQNHLTKLKEVSEQIKVNSDKDTDNYQLHSSTTVTSQITEFIQQERYSELYHWIQNNLKSYPHLSEEYKSILLSLNAELKRLIEESEGKEISEIKSILEQIKTTIYKSKKPEDLDDLLALVSSKSKLFSSHSHSFSSTQNKELKALKQSLQSSGRIVSEWQNYLIAEIANNSQECRRSLENLSRSLTENPIIPRSYVLRLLNPVPVEQASATQGAHTSSDGDQNTEDTPIPATNFTPFPDIVQRLTDGEDIQVVSDLIQQLPQAQFDSREVTNFNGALMVLKGFDTKSNTSSFNEAMDYLRRSHRSSSDIRLDTFAKARNKIIMPILLEKYADVLTDTNEQFHSPESLLNHLFDLVRKEKNWQRSISVTKDLETYADFLRSPSETSYRNKASALTSLAKAEAASVTGEVGLGIKNYRTAISKTDDPLIFQICFEGLQNLRETYPEEYNAASELEKATTFVELDQRLARYAYSRRQSSYRDRHSESAITPEVQKLITETIQVELSKKKLDGLDDKLETDASKSE